MYTNLYQSSEGGTVSHVDLVLERFTPAQVKVVVELELLCLVKKKIISKIFVGENDCCFLCIFLLRPNISQMPQTVRALNVMAQQEKNKYVNK